MPPVDVWISPTENALGSDSVSGESFTEDPAGGAATGCANPMLAVPPKDVRNICFVMVKASPELPALMTMVPPAFTADTPAPSVLSGAANVPAGVPVKLKSTHTGDGGRV